MVQVGRSVIGNCKRKLGICGVWESIRMEVSRVFGCGSMRGGQCFSIF